MAGWSLVVYGNPAPQGSKRHVGGGVMVESSKKVKPWRADVKDAGLKVKESGARCLDGPVAIRMVFTLERPKSRPKRDVAPDRTPDISKLCRSTEDALKEAGLIADDARLVDYHRLAKVWAGYDPEALPMPGVLVLAAEIDGPMFARVGRQAAAERTNREWRRFGTPRPVLAVGGVLVPKGGA